MEGICKHNMTGFCKFGEQCRKRHIKEICFNNECTSTSCIKRHPRICKFFSMHGSCKFGEECAYRHIISKEQSDISELSAQIKILTSTIRDMSKSLLHLEKEIETLKDERKVKSTFKCDKCSESFSSEYLLNNHVEAQHINTIINNMNSFTDPFEIVRIEEVNISLELSSDKATREEDFFLDCETAIESCPLSSTPYHITEGQCTYPSCLDIASNFFQKTKLDVSQVKYNGCKQISSYSNVFLCDLHIKFVPFLELRKNPPVIL